MWARSLDQLRSVQPQPQPQPLQLQANRGGTQRLSVAGGAAGAGQGRGHLAQARPLCLEGRQQLGTSAGSRQLAQASGSGQGPSSTTRRASSGGSTRTGVTEACGGVSTTGNGRGDGGGIGAAAGRQPASVSSTAAAITSSTARASAVSQQASRPAGQQQHLHRMSSLRGGGIRVHRGSRNPRAGALGLATGGRGARACPFQGWPARGSAGRGAAHQRVSNRSDRLGPARSRHHALGSRGMTCQGWARPQPRRHRRARLRFPAAAAPIRGPARPAPQQPSSGRTLLWRSPAASAA
jgi:hypothetical protein